MLPRADLNTARPPSSVEASTRSVSSTDARLEVFRRFDQIAIGRELQATVDNMLDDGSYLVRIADGNARMALPVGTRVGDQLSLIFIAREPRPTFLLNQSGGSAPATLSATARLIDHALHAAADADGVTGSTPLLPSSAQADPGRIADALRDQLARSGLFYESHLQEWMNGRRTAEQLAQEPQAGFGRAAPQADGELAQLAGNLRELGEGVNKLLDLMRDARVPAANPQLLDADVIARSGAAMPAIDPEAARLIGLQLNALEQQQLRWRGELWPGQELEWDVSREQRGDDGQAPEQEVWNSAVRFELPHLGTVSATIRLSGNHVQLQVNTASEDSATLLRGHAASLADALQAAGASLDGLLVKRDESA
ncbi:flagellar hook-length control protein FliK [Noviherbaspirillum aridicola]|uniref:Flagellar hook-length control protein-like C-terminal domain-containing protein n=1 Tax=Noviherbaspirillum aridicola TaxID=2849687 RepID=A0ABQ4Q657_9BURK|nr:flagellar hook-length control protein FliK [Noviherbaspirillum aridicola]GIZ52692.1 hypothetical protein NCCP691_27060 [Noviherbaspirillum aridicola]